MTNVLVCERKCVLVILWHHRRIFRNISNVGEAMFCLLKRRVSAAYQKYSNSVKAHVGSSYSSADSIPLVLHADTSGLSTSLGVVRKLRKAVIIFWHASNHTISL